MPIKWVLLDLGGVLIKLGDSLFPKQWLGNRRYALEDWFQSEVASEFERGLVSPQAFFAAIKTQLKIQASISEIEHAFRAWLEGLYPNTKAILHGLKNDYQLAVLSNTNAIHESVILNDFGLERLIDTFFFSHHLGLAKPDPKSFAHVLETLNAQPQEIVFFDDNAANVASAIELGLHGFRVDGPDSILDLVRSLVPTQTRIMH